MSKKTEVEHVTERKAPLKKADATERKTSGKKKEATLTTERKAITPSGGRSHAFEPFTVEEKHLEYYICSPQEITKDLMTLCKDNNIRAIVKTTPQPLTGQLDLLKFDNIEVIDFVLESKFPSPPQIDKWIETLDKAYNASLKAKAATANAPNFTFMIFTHDCTNKAPLLVSMALKYRGYTLPEALHKIRSNRSDAINVDYFEFLVRWEPPQIQSVHTQSRDRCFPVRSRETMCTRCLLF
mmetsp:Transcript_14112/g.26440  ORF Transcript_14112/g.26440 Transcript_14112/m.26440 type:complete len:240 (-) Transcript_14112:1501-2220(-)